MKKAILVSYASPGRDVYFKKQLNLIRSIIESKIDIDTYIVADGGYCDEYMGIKIDLSFPASKNKTFHRHPQIPYQFKLAVIQRAMEDGYEKIFWADSIFNLIPGKNIVALLDEQPEGILAFHNLGHDLYKYISDKAVQNLLMTDEDLFEIPQTFGGFFGIDITKESASSFIEELYYQSNAGSYADGISSRNGFIAHRHDQAVMSVLLHSLGVKLLPYGTIVYGEHHLPPYEYGKDFYGYFA